MTRPPIEYLKAEYGHWKLAMGEQPLFHLADLFDYVEQLDAENAELRNKCEAMMKETETDGGYVGRVGIDGVWPQ